MYGYFYNTSTQTGGNDMYYNNEINYLKYLKEKSIIIFGAGKMGVQGLFKMQKEKIHVTAFCDND